MTAQTITTTVNYDDASISALLNGETITVNGGALTIDADVRWNQQAAVFGAITLSSSGGSLLIDGAKVWEVPFSASTGNVPTQTALGSNGVTGGTSGATGELTRVWATGSLTPATAGGAMPSTGFIKLRSKTGDFQAGETITLPGGATITASGAGKRSWIHIVGRGVTSGTGSRLTIPRLGRFEATGDWFELGTTDGNDNQTFQYPVADQCPAIWIETAAGSGVYEIWLNALDRWNDGAVSTSDRRGMYFSCSATTGVITIAARGANNAGLKPPSGCRVRVPNVIMSQADGTTPAWDTNILPTAITSRYSFTTSNAGALILDKVSCNWFASTASAFSVNVRNSGFGTSVSFTGVGTTTTVENCGIGIVDQTTGNQFVLNTNFGGGTVTDVFAARRQTATSTYVFDISQSDSFTFTRCRADCFGNTGTNRPIGTLGYSAVRAYRMKFKDCISVGNIYGWAAQPCYGFNVEGARFAGRTIGTTQAIDVSIGVNANVGSSDCVLDGFANFDGLANVHPYSFIMVFGNGSARCLVQNIGTPSAPYNMGTADACGFVLSASVAVDLKVQRVYVQNVRQNFWQTLNTVLGLQGINVWSDAANTQAILSLNTVIRGARYTHSTVGQAAVYGTHWSDAWVSTTAGRIVIACNEPTPSTLDQCSATLSTASGSGFDAAGSIVMKALTDEVIWTMPYFALGVTGFANSAPTITGTNAANHTLDFQYDLNNGAGYNGTWLALTGANLSAITVDPAKGVRLKVRAKVNTASATNALTYIAIATTTNATAQQIEYPLPGAIATINNLIAGSRVKVTRVDTGALLAQDATAGTSITFDVPYSGSVLIEARKGTGTPAYRPWVTQANITTGSTITVTALQEID